MAEKKIFINSDNIATLVCPKCQRVKDTDVSECKQANEEVRVNCECICGHCYSVVLERREFYRREVNLYGIYILNNSEEQYPLIVKDLSFNGLKFEIKTELNFNVGDNIFVEFQLDDNNQTFIKREVIVRSIGKYSVGAEFRPSDSKHSSDKALEAYLFS